MEKFITAAAMESVISPLPISAQVAGISNGNFQSGFSGWLVDSDSLGDPLSSSDFSIVNNAAQIQVDYSDNLTAFANTLYQALDLSAKPTDKLILSFDWKLTGDALTTDETFGVGLVPTGVVNYYDSTNLGFLLEKTSYGSGKFSTTLDSSFANQVDWTLEFQLLRGFDGLGSTLQIDNVSLVAETQNTAVVIPPVPTGFVKTLLSNRIFTVSDNDANVIGGTAENEIVRIQSGVTNTTLNANIERVELSNALSAYKFVAVSGVGIEIWDTSSKIATIPSLNQDTKIAFSNGTAILKQTGASDFQLGNAAISSGTATTPSNVVIDTADLSGSQNASTATGFVKTLLSNRIFTVSDNDANVIGGTAGNEIVRIQSGVTNTTLNANIERVELSNALSAYKFVAVSGVGVEIWNATSKIATIPSLNQDTKIAFSNGTTVLKQTGASDFQLGNVAISNTTATTLSNVLLDSSDLSTIGVTGSTNINATNLVGTGTAGVDTFNIAAGTYNASINGFAAGDKLSFFAGASLEITPDNNQTDGIQQLTATNAATGATTTLTLTGLTSAQDSGIFNVTSFNTVFGAGSIA